MRVLVYAMPTLAVYRPPWYPRWHPGDLTVTYDTPTAVEQPPAKRLRALCERAALERYRRSRLAPWVLESMESGGGSAFSRFRSRRSE